jgi:hypothetical protein
VVAQFPEDRAFPHDLGGIPEFLEKNLGSRRPLVLPNMLRVRLAQLLYWGLHTRDNHREVTQPLKYHKKIPYPWPVASLGHATRDNFCCNLQRNISNSLTMLDFALFCSHGNTGYLAKYVVCNVSSPRTGSKWIQSLDWIKINSPHFRQWFICMSVISSPPIRTGLDFKSSYFESNCVDLKSSPVLITQIWNILISSHVI